MTIPIVRCWTLALLLLAAPALAGPPVPVGERHGSACLASAAARDAQQRDSVRYTVWYPAQPGASEQPVLIGPPQAPLFTVGSAAPQAAVASGRLPVLLLSHGNGGSARMMGWFGIGMARAGYLVIAVDHPGNNGVDPPTTAGSVLMWERAGDLAAAWAAVQADPQLSAHLDTRRVGVAGFSAGGFTALLAAGARADMPRLLAFCAAHPDDGVCQPQAETPALTLTQRQAAASTPALAPFVARSGDDHGIAGVRAVFVMAPAMLQAFPPATLQALRQPVSILVGDADRVAPPATNAAPAAASIPDAQLRILPAVGHYDFLSDCTAVGLQRIGALCQVATPRAATHQAAIAQAAQFFAEALSEPGSR